MKRKRAEYVAPTDSVYKNYYLNQAGHGIPVYKGSGLQRGHGLGSILGGLLRSAAPLMKSAAKTIGREALNFGVGLAKDALSGEDVKTSAEKRGRLLGTNLLDSVVQPQQRSKKRKTVGNKMRQPKPNKKRRQEDIFG